MESTQKENSISLQLTVKLSPLREAPKRWGNSIMAKLFYFIFLLVLVQSCSPSGLQEEKKSSLYPDTMTLWKAINGPEHEDQIYFFFPNDSLILQYHLRTWSAYSENGMRDKEMSDFHSNHIYLKKDGGYMHHHAFWKHDAQFFFSGQNSNLTMNLEDDSKLYSGIYTLEKVNEFDSLPSDPRKNWLSYYHKLFADTLVRFSSENPVNYIIYSYRGVNIDSLELEPYYGNVYYRTPASSDTFFVAKGTNRIFVVSKSDTQNHTVLSSLGSFEVSIINRNDSLTRVKVMDRVHAYEDSINANKKTAPNSK